MIGSSKAPRLLSKCRRGVIARASTDPDGRGGEVGLFKAPESVGGAEYVRSIREGHRHLILWRFTSSILM